MDRRTFLRSIAAGAASLALAPLLARKAAAVSPTTMMEHTFMPLRPDDNPTPAITLSDDEWRQRLPADSYDVLRHEGTERPESSPLTHEKHAGTFLCRGCGLSLFSSDAKYESGTGWPSFFQPIKPGHVGTKTDRKLFTARTEVHCARCGGHLGHVFEDGPQPTGLRYCMNGVALQFQPKK